MRAIFLEFDGVLHSAKHTTELFRHTEDLARALEGHDDVQIVVSSPWRLSHSIEALRHILGPLGSKVQGITPSIRGASRQAEIEAWVENSPTLCSWLAIDSQPRQFDLACAWLLPTDASTGFDQDDAKLLGAWLNTDLLPVEEEVFSSFLMQRKQSFLKDVLFKCTLYRKSHRLLIEVPIIDTYLLDDLLVDAQAAMGITNLCGQDSVFELLRSDWHIEILVGQTRLRMEAICSGSGTRKTTLLICPQEA